MQGSEETGRTKQADRQLATKTNRSSPYIVARVVIVFTGIGKGVRGQLFDGMPSSGDLC